MTGQPRASAEEWRQVSDTLSHAQHIAAQKWDRVSCDAYQCLSLAWKLTGTDSAVPFSALTTSLRRLLPSGDILGWNDTDGLTRGDVAALMGRAARSVILRAVA
jgi:hypothetical protein